MSSLKQDKNHSSLERLTENGRLHPVIELIGSWSNGATIDGNLSKTAPHTEGGHFDF